MSEVVAFKSGKDIGPEPSVVDEEQVTCVDCDARTTDQNAYESGWQFAPPVCPNCLRWLAVADACCHGRTI